MKSSFPRVKNNTTVIEKLAQKKHERTTYPAHKYNLRHKIYPPSYRLRAARTLLAQRIFSTLNASYIYNDERKRLTIDKLVKGEDSETCLKSLSMEFGRLAQGNKYGVQYTDTIYFISQKDVPMREKVTYKQFVCDHLPLKHEPFGVRIEVGGDKLDCDIDAGHQQQI